MYRRAKPTELLSDLVEMWCETLEAFSCKERKDGTEPRLSRSRFQINNLNLGHVLEWIKSDSFLSVRSLFFIDIQKSILLQIFRLQRSAVRSIFNSVGEN
jgi:hypothetical protein